MRRRPRKTGGGVIAGSRIGVKRGSSDGQLTSMIPQHIGDPPPKKKKKKTPQINPIHSFVPEIWIFACLYTAGSLGAPSK